jgi:hypothetical protein
MMDPLGQVSPKFRILQEIAFIFSRNSNCSFSFWWRSSTNSWRCRSVTEEYNGTSWTGVLLEVLNTARYAGVGGAGTQTAALAFGGLNAPLGGQNATEEYDGTSWSGGVQYLNTEANAL